MIRDKSRGTKHVRVRVHAPAKMRRNLRVQLVWGGTVQKGVWQASEAEFEDISEAALERYPDDAPCADFSLSFEYRRDGDSKRIRHEVTRSPGKRRRR
jgi:hypothetical protein